MLVVEIISKFTNLNIAEVIFDILEAHPEQPILCILLEPNLFFNFISPTIRVVRPSSLPLSGAPGIPKLK